jgi:hypothetical protein
MPLDTSDILFSLFKMTFNLKGSVDQEFSLINKIYKKKTFFGTNSNKIRIFCFGSNKRLKQDATQHILHFISFI